VSTKYSQTGKFKCPREGTVHFKWNNSFSWLTSKLLSYSIRMSQPAFPIADQNRCQKSRAMLTSAVEESRKLHSKLRKAKDKVKGINDDIYATGIFQFCKV
jgi:hypothetical protein